LTNYKQGTNRVAKNNGRLWLRTCDPLKTKTKNLSKKKEQEAFCALPLAEIEQDSSLAGSK
jgi:hypothetical protein